MQLSHKHHTTLAVTPITAEANTLAYLVSLCSRPPGTCIHILRLRRSSRRPTATATRRRAATRRRPRARRRRRPRARRRSPRRPPSRCRRRPPASRRGRRALKRACLHAGRAASGYRWRVGRGCMRVIVLPSGAGTTCRVSSTASRPAARRHDQRAGFFLCHGGVAALFFCSHGGVAALSGRQGLCAVSPGPA